MHKLDPRVKLFGVLIFIISLFFFGNIASYVIATVVLGICIFLTKVPFKYVVRGLKPVLMLLVITSILNIFITPGEVFIRIWRLSITKEGIFLSIHITVRLMYLIMASSVLTLTTTPTRLTDALEKILRPLSKIKVPVHEISMMMSISLRFVPILVEEADKIMKAQTARGLNFNDRNIIRKVKNLAALIVPLFVSAVRRSNELALAMESRCYQGGEGRTKMRALKYRRIDVTAYLLIVLYFVGLLLLNKLVKLK